MQSTAHRPASRLTRRGRYAAMTAVVFGSAAGMFLVCAAAWILAPSGGVR